MHRRVSDRCIANALGSARQHFFKLDAVFFVWLVYSGGVHLYPECTQRLSHLTSGGQHGEESEEGEEGEERSEEDCEEDPQGLQEEEVSLA